MPGHMIVYLARSHMEGSIEYSVHQSIEGAAKALTEGCCASDEREEAYEALVVRNGWIGEGGISLVIERHALRS